MTSTAVISAQSFGTGSDIGNGKFSISPTTLQTSTTAYVVNAKVIATNSQRGVFTRVWYTTCFESTTATNAPTQLAQTARYVDVEHIGTGATSFTVKKDSSLEPITGGFFNCWVDVPTLTAAATLTVTLIELP